MKSREERIEYFRRIKTTADQDAKRPSYPIKNWRGKTLYAKIVEVDSEYLMYRIENSRTEIQQLTYLRRHNLPKDFFSDPESVKVQQAQESILTDMAKGKDLLNELDKHKQEDPCIITYDGYIVNGNRRTAALRFLGKRYVDCVILNADATPRDIYILEQQLQIAQDFKEPYHWINELRNIRKGFEDSRLELKEDELAKNLRKDLKDIRVMRRTLDLVDAFLIWKNIPGEYDYPKLDKAEEVFRQLEKAVKKYSKDLQKMEALRKMVFNLVEERPLETRLYKHVGDLIKNFDKVYSKLLEDEMNSEKEVVTSTRSDNHELLDELLDAEIDEISTILDHPENASETSNKLIDIIADVNAENRERRDAELVFDSVSEALRQLQGLTIDSDTSKIGSVKNKLKQIIASSERLLEEIKGLDKQ